MLDSVLRFGRSCRRHEVRGTGLRQRKVDWIRMRYIQRDPRGSLQGGYIDEVTNAHALIGTRHEK